MSGEDVAAIDLGLIAAVVMPAATAERIERSRSVSTCFSMSAPPIFAPAG